MFSQKVVVVTGAGRGIGRETALLFGRKGARVVVNDLGGSTGGAGADPGPAEETARLIREAGGEAVVSTDSVAEWPSAQRIVEAAMDHYGRIDVVVNNAGNVCWGRFWEFPIEEFDAVIRTHTYGAFYVSRAAAVHFKAQQGGAYVHTTSTSGLMGLPDHLHYCTAKASLVGLSKAIALEMREFGVRSNCMAPFALTRMAQGRIQSPEHQTELDKLTPLQPATVTVALASDAAREVTGQVFIVRGNEIMVAGQGFPLATAWRSDGWTPEQVIAEAMPELAPGFTPPISFHEYFGAVR